VVPPASSESSPPRELFHGRTNGNGGTLHADVLAHGLRAELQTWPIYEARLQLRPPRIVQRIQARAWRAKFAFVILPGNVVFRRVDLSSPAGRVQGTWWVSELDTDHDGIEELAIQDNTTGREFRAQVRRLVHAIVVDHECGTSTTEIAKRGTEPPQLGSCWSAGAGDHHFALPRSEFRHRRGGSFKQFHERTNSYSSIPSTSTGDGRPGSCFFDRFTHHHRRSLFHRLRLDTFPDNVHGWFSHQRRTRRRGGSRTTRHARDVRVHGAGPETKSRVRERNRVRCCSVPRPTCRVGTGREPGTWKWLDVGRRLASTSSWAIDDAAVRASCANRWRHVRDRSAWSRDVPVARERARTPFRSGDGDSLLLDSVRGPPVAIPRVRCEWSVWSAKLDERMSAGPHEDPTGTAVTIRGHCDRGRTACSTKSTANGVRQTGANGGAWGASLDGEALRLAQRGSCRARTASRRRSRLRSKQQSGPM